ncbi:MarR family transcriptional regulator [Lachnospiraceae bacterium 62-35]
MGDIQNGLLIKQIHDRLEKRANNALRSKDLTLMQMSVLMILQKMPEKMLSMKEIERHFQVAQSTVAGIVARLEQKGFVEAFGDVADKRIKLVHMTPIGEACCEETAHYRNEAEETLLRGFSKEEQATLNSLLLRAADNVK